MFMISGACSSALHLLLDRFEHLDDETVYRAYGGMIHYSTYCLCKGSELQPPLSLGAIALSSVRIMDQFVCRCTVPPCINRSEYPRLYQQYYTYISNDLRHPRLY